MTEPGSDGVEDLLAETARRAAEELFAPEALREAGNGRQGVLHPGWQQLAELGFLGLMVDEEFGGSGGDLSSACVVAEALGVVLAPVPFPSSAIMAAAMLRHCGGRGEDLERLALGVPYAIVVDRALRWPPRRTPLAMWGWVDGAAVLGRRSDGVAERLDLQPSGGNDSIGLVQPVLTVDEDRSPGFETTALAGVPDDGERRVLAIARVGCAAGLLGIARGALDAAVSYAKEREQYGRPIGAFQAVQHMCADMHVDVETSSSIVRAAAAAVEHVVLDEAERTAASVKAWVSEAAVRVCETSIQVLGGIGVTWEHPAHLRLREAHLLRSMLGGPDDCYDLLAQGAFDRIDAGRPG